MNGQTDKLIVKVLRESKKSLTAYEIAKRLKISWPTATKHCLDLLLEGMIDREVKSSLSGKKILWRAK